MLAIERVGDKEGGRDEALVNLTRCFNFNLSTEKTLNQHKMHIMKSKAKKALRRIFLIASHLGCAPIEIYLPLHTHTHPRGTAGLCVSLPNS